MKVDSFQCDVCGKMREKDANRWWAARTECGDLKVTKFDAMEADEKHLYQHCCGEDCAIQLVQRWMATGNFDRPHITHIEPITTVLKELPKL